MSRKTIAALLAQADTTIEDNTTQNISPADVRSMVKDFVDSMTPGFASITNASLAFPSLGGGVPQIVTCTASPVSTSGSFTPNFAAGTITRLAQGLPSTINNLQFTCNAFGPAGTPITFGMYRDGVLIPTITVDIDVQGNANPKQVVLLLIDVVNDSANHVYDVRVVKAGSATAITLASVRFAAQSIPSLT